VLKRKKRRRKFFATLAFDFFQDHLKFVFKNIAIRVYFFSSKNKIEKKEKRWSFNLSRILKVNLSWSPT